MKNKILTFILKVKVLVLATKGANLFHFLILNLNNEKIAIGASFHFSFLYLLLGSLFTNTNLSTNETIILIARLYFGLIL